MSDSYRDHPIIDPKRQGASIRSVLPIRMKVEKRGSLCPIIPITDRLCHDYALSLEDRADAAKLDDYFWFAISFMPFA